MVKKLMKLLLGLSSIFFLYSCSGTKTSFDFDSSVDFSQIKTYQWDMQPSSAFAKQDPLLSKRVIQAMDDNMSRKGFTKSDSADVTLSYHISVEKKLSSSALSAGIGMSVGKSGRGHINLSSGNQLRTSLQGTLVIDMVSTGKKELIWRSTTVKKIHGREATPDESTKRIGQLVYKMFESYPPK
ncbi:MAG: hypothetical protein DIZ80_08065 [endosymbiont of Galathealinum brachiosum]|uniref:DUF4136 domain-containing protein n=1 Tax=endosymbiont of Galathealinum brachiosum TaxID=2200906 RepID=A0A370DGN4_9GAMM|nr:MAG: hypothetical protein DIZ80_08065 [endosymbiont of Galathealinum brachiosum]